MTDPHAHTNGLHKQIRLLIKERDQARRHVERLKGRLRPLQALASGRGVLVQTSSPEASTGLQEALELRSRADRGLAPGEVTRVDCGDVDVPAPFTAVIVAKPGRHPILPLAMAPLSPGRQRVWVDVVNTDSFQQHVLRPGYLVATLVITTIHRPNIQPFPAPSGDIS